MKICCCEKYGNGSYTFLFLVMKDMTVCSETLYSHGSLKPDIRATGESCHLHKVKPSFSSESYCGSSH